MVREWWWTPSDGERSRIVKFSCHIQWSSSGSYTWSIECIGASLYTCYREKQCNFNITVINPGSISAVSSDPLRVCICDSYGVPQCSDNVTHINSQTVHPGESFSVPAVIVGFDTQSGATTGTVYADFLPTENSMNMKLHSNTHVINDSKRCTNLEYAVFVNTVSNNTSVMIYINTIDLRTKRLSVTHPVYINITLLPCPPGFSLRNQSCDCYLHHELYDDCHIINRKGYFLWSKKIWVNIYKVSGGILYNTHCPYDYCNITDSWIDLQNDANSQCSFNRGGRLCGGCKENYSLAIGSSHCIHCPNNNNLALLVFFAAAGFLLVFFISAFNLTVTQGMINGLIFYANIVWLYQSIFFPQELKTNTIIKFLKTFIAWINLDFGIETCFFSGLTAFWKIWLQFIFPFYIWTITGLIIVATRYSTRLTNFLGNKAVPVLNTLFLLSYMKLSRIVAAVMIFSTITGYPQTNTDSVVWSVDGNLSYFGFPHIWLFLAGLATLLFLWLPFTLLLLSMQWLRRVSHFRLLKWITRFHPVYDAYFAPLKHKHQYWFGVLLLTRGILLMTFASTFAIPQSINLLLLLVFATVLLYYMAVVHPYKIWGIFVLESSSILNLTLLSGFHFFTYTQGNGQSTQQTVAVGVSTGVAFLQFCGIVLYPVIKIIHTKCIQARCYNFGNNDIELPLDFYDSYRDPVVDNNEADHETQPLLSFGNEPIATY